MAMDHFITLPVGLLETNCYLVPVGKRLYLIDPGADAPEIIEAAGQFDYDEAIILLTHAHVDHIGAVGATARALSAKRILLSAADEPLYASKENQLLPYLPRVTDLPPTSAKFDGLDCEVIFTPGHTPGGCCYYFQSIPAIFVGDTLFAGSIGRTDLPGGSGRTLLESIQQRLMVLPDDLKFYPGHGPVGTIGHEKKYNPYLSGC